ncbi:MAG: TonB-dependent receptor [Flavobacteriales bacterium]|nr:TonB-dependent receptor [Flavobacteriales bacterium]
MRSSCSDPTVDTRRTRRGRTFPRSSFPRHGQGFPRSPRQKATLTGLLKIGTQLDLRAAGIWQSEACSYAFRDDSETDLDLRRHPATLRLDMGIGYRSRLVEGLTLVAGCRNILDQRLELLSAYNNGLAAFPLNGREWTLQINYRFPF